MRFTSLVIELIRARPRLIVWIAVLLQAAMWLFVALVFYRSPPGTLATLLAFGREYQDAALCSLADARGDACHADPA